MVTFRVNLRRPKLLLYLRVVLLTWFRITDLFLSCRASLKFMRRLCITDSIIMYVVIIYLFQINTVFVMLIQYIWLILIYIILLLLLLRMVLFQLVFF